MMTFAAALFATIPLGLTSPSTAAPTLASADDTTAGNVLILVLDDIGVDGLNAYGLGTDLPSTPNIDALASKGVVFDNAWSNPVCSPTRATIQTGRYPLHTGVGYTVTEYAQELELSEVTIPEMLKLTGTNITSGAFGKWHLGNSSNGGSSSPNLAGYDHYEGALINLHPPQSYYRYFKTNNGFSFASLKYVTSEAVDDARDWINSQRSQCRSRGLHMSPSTRRTRPSTRPLQSFTRLT